MIRDRVASIVLVGLALLEGAVAYWAVRKDPVLAARRAAPTRATSGDAETVRELAGFRVVSRGGALRATQGAFALDASGVVAARADGHELVIEGAQLVGFVEGGAVVAPGRAVAALGAAEGSVLWTSEAGAVRVGAPSVYWSSGPTRLVAEGSPIRVSLLEDAAHDCHVVPATAGVTVVAFDDEGRPKDARTTDASGRFPRLPRGRLTAFVGGFRVGELAKGAGASCEVPITPLASLHVRVRDAEKGTASPARVAIHARPGTKEPNFGSPERASGAGPLVDAETGRVDMLLPAGGYDVVAMRGIEFSHAAASVELAAGKDATLDLELVRVAPTPGWASADLHVHSRGSFDSWVSIEDRVRSLVSVGVDFAAASEHNRVGSYETALVGGGRLAWIQSVEVTTTSPLRGHFNVIPFSQKPVPRHQATTLAALVADVRRRAPDALLQVNHPRLGMGIGHFNSIHLDTDTKKGLARLARGFDTLEVYNGFEIHKPENVDRVVAEWLRLLEAGRTVFATGSSDSHTIQYIGAGFPRTLVEVKDDHDDGEGPPLDVAGLVAALKRGKAIATSGPLVEVDGMGERRDPKDGVLDLHVRVRAAPWVGPSVLTAYSGGRAVLSRELPAAKPGGTPEEQRASALLLDETLRIPVLPSDRAVVVVVRATESVVRSFPYMDWKPMAITNPVFVRDL